MLIKINKNNFIIIKLNLFLQRFLGGAGHSGGESKPGHRGTETSYSQFS